MCSGSLDRCVEGETSRTILSTLDVPPSSLTVHSVSASPLHVMSLSAGLSDQHIQVLLFNPNLLIQHLSKLVTHAFTRIHMHTFMGTYMHAYLLSGHNSHAEQIEGPALVFNLSSRVSELRSELNIS